MNQAHQWHNGSTVAICMAQVYVSWMSKSGGVAYHQAIVNNTLKFRAVL
jgi:hypothetical protein